MQVCNTYCRWAKRSAVLFDVTIGSHPNVGRALVASRRRACVRPVRVTRHADSDLLPRPARGPQPRFSRSGHPTRSRRLARRGRQRRGALFVHRRLRSARCSARSSHPAEPPSTISNEWSVQELLGTCKRTYLRMFTDQKAAHRQPGKASNG